MDTVTSPTATTTPIRKESVQDKTTVALLANQIIIYFNDHCHKANNNIAVDSNTNTSNNNNNKNNENELIMNQSIGGAPINLSIDKLMKTLLESTTSDISFYATHLLENEPLFQCILNTILLDSFGTKNDLICKWFFSWYNLNCSSSKKFVLSFLPALLWVYLTKCHPTNGVLIGLESCLICIYNQEYIKRVNKEKLFNPPTLSLPSFIYKSDELFGNAINSNNNLTENMLKLINTQFKPIVLEKPLPRIEFITSANRNILLKTIQTVYTQNVLLLSIFSRVLFCEMTTRISGLGYKFIDNYPICERISKINNSKSLLNIIEAEKEEEATTSTHNHRHRSSSSNELCNSIHYKPIMGLTNYLIHRDDPIKQNNYIEQLSKKRVFLSENIYQEFITALTCCAFQETTKVCAKISVQSINERASFDLVPEIILSSNSLLHLLNQKK